MMPPAAVTTIRVRAAVSESPIRVITDPSHYRSEKPIRVIAGSRDASESFPGHFQVAADSFPGQSQVKSESFPGPFQVTSESFELVSEGIGGRGCEGGTRVCKKIQNTKIYINNLNIN